MADSFDEDNSYLQPGFDPSTLTMPKLRNILFQHDIQYPSGAKKPQLVEVFETQLRPKAKRILAQQARVKRTSLGIQDMASRAAEDDDDDDDGEEQSALTPVRRETRKASAAPSTTSTRSRTSRRSARTPATDAGTDDDTESVVSRRSRYSTATPVPETPSESGRSTRGGARRSRLSDFDPPTPARVKEEEEGEESDQDGQSTPKGPSPFTLDNPFQSGTSPTEVTAKATPRKKAGAKTMATKSRPSYDTPNVAIKDEEESPPATRNRKSRGQSARLSDGVAIKSSSSRNVSLEPGEEFTQEEQEELDEEELSGDLALPERRKKSSSAAKSGPLVVLTTILAGVAMWWRQEKLAAGYCGIGSSGQVISLSNSNVDLPEFLSGLQPECEPCPQHAYCYPDFEVRCEKDYVLVPHPFSLGGLVPLSPTCEPDSDKARKVKAVADRAVEELRQQHAKYECGDIDDSGKTVTAPGLSEETLKAKVSARRRRGMTESEFEELWVGAIGDVLGREEVTKTKEGRHNARHGVDADRESSILSSTSLARLPIGCAIRRSARLSVERYRVPLALIAASLALLAYLRRRFSAMRTERARVPQLVSIALDRLSTQAALHDQGRAQEPYLSMVGLRDDLLRDEFSAARRDAIWARVRAVAEANANVRAGVREVRAGDVTRVWEWTGPLPQIDDGSYSSGYESRRQSGRWSLGDGRDGIDTSFLSSAGGGAGLVGTPDRAGSSSPIKARLGGNGGSAATLKREDSTSRARDSSPAIKKEKEMIERRRWNEGRAAF